MYGLDLERSLTCLIGADAIKRNRYYDMTMRYRIASYRCWLHERSIPGHFPRVTSNNVNGPRTSLFRLYRQGPPLSSPIQQLVDFLPRTEGYRVGLNFISVVLATRLCELSPIPRTYGVNLYITAKMRKKLNDQAIYIGIHCSFLLFFRNISNLDFRQSRLADLSHILTFPEYSHPPALSRHCPHHHHEASPLPLSTRSAPHQRRMHPPQPLQHHSL